MANSNRGDKEKYDYAYILGVLPSYTNVELEYDNPNEWYFKAAKQGYSAAEFQLGQNMLYGKNCSADTTKGFVWLSRAAMDGHSDAQYLLAIELLNGVRLQRDVNKAIRWLEKASEKGDYNARLRLAWILATSQDEKFRDAGKALHYAKSVPD